MLLVRAQAFAVAQSARRPAVFVVVEITRPIPLALEAIACYAWFSKMILANCTHSIFQGRVLISISTDRCNVIRFTILHLIGL